MEIKKCCTCGEFLPRTDQFFFKKVTKQKSKKTGDTLVYESFRSDCKKCHGAKGLKRRQQKRCEELGCSLDDYQETWRKNMALKKMKYKELYNLPITRRAALRKRIDKGYKFTTYEEYRNFLRKEVSAKKRKYDYGICDFVSQKDKNRSGIINLTDSYVSATLGCKIGDLPQQVIETRRNVLKLKRELKMTKYER